MAFSNQKGSKSLSKLWRGDQVSVICEPLRRVSEVIDHLAKCTILEDGVDVNHILDGESLMTRKDACLAGVVYS